MWMWYVYLKTVITSFYYIYVNQLLFETTLFRDLPEIWTGFRQLIFATKPNPHLFFLIQLYGKYWSMARNICDNEALANFTKISRMQIKVGSQFVRE